MEYTVYILRTSSNTLYVGQTNNLVKRLKEHEETKGLGAKYMRIFKSFELVYSKKFLSRSSAMKKEIALKKLSHAEKEQVIKNK